MGIWDTGWVLCLILPLTTGRVQVMQYGQYGGLNLKCGRDELIFVQSELLGFSKKPGSCAPRPLCSVPYTLAKWFCRGRSSCSGMQVERRPLHRRTCGSDFTNCLRVEYECVKRSMLTDICSSTDFTTSHGFIASPKFPQLYPPNQNCSCILESDETVHLHSAFFLLRSSRPCKDWLSIETEERQEKKRCGYVPEQRPSFGHSIQMNFHSDKTSQDMGFWMPFFGANRNATVRVRCGTALELTTTLAATTPSTVVATTAENQGSEETQTKPMAPQSREKNEEFVTDLSLLELDMMYFDHDTNDSSVTNKSKKTPPKDNRVVKNLDYEYYPLYYDYDEYYDDEDEIEYSSTVQRMLHTTAQPTTPIHYTVTEPAPRNVDSTTPTMGIQILNPVDNYKLTPQILSALKGLKNLEKKPARDKAANEVFEKQQSKKKPENMNFQPVTISHMQNKMLRPEMKTAPPEIEEPILDEMVENITETDSNNSNSSTINYANNMNDTNIESTTEATTEEQTLVTTSSKVVREEDAKEIGESPGQPILQGPSKAGPYNWLPFLIQPNMSQTPPTPITIYDSNLIQITLKGTKPNNMEKIVPWLHKDDNQKKVTLGFKNKIEEVTEKPETKTTPSPETTYPFNWFDLKQWKGNEENTDEKDPYMVHKNTDKEGNAIDKKMGKYEDKEVENEFVRKDLWKYITTRPPPSPSSDEGLVLVLPNEVVDEMGGMKAEEVRSKKNQRKELEIQNTDGKEATTESKEVQHEDAREGEDSGKNSEESVTILQHSPPGFFQYYQNLQEQRFLAQQQMLHQLQEQLLQQQIRGRQDTSKEQLLQLQQLRGQQQQLYMQRQQQMIKELQLQQKIMQQKIMQHEAITTTTETTTVTENINPKEGAYKSLSEYTTQRPIKLEPATHFLEIMGPQHDQQKIKMTAPHANPRQAIPFKDYLMFLKAQEENPQQPVPNNNDQRKENEDIPTITQQNDKNSTESKAIESETVPISSPPIDELRYGNKELITRQSHKAETNEKNEEISNNPSKPKSETEHKLIGFNPFHRMMGPMDLPPLIDPNEEIYAQKRKKLAQNLRDKDAQLQGKEYEHEDSDYEEKLEIEGFSQTPTLEHQTETNNTATTQLTTEATVAKETKAKSETDDEKWKEEEIMLQQILKARLEFLHQQLENTKQQRQDELLLKQQHHDEQQKQQQHLQQQLQLRLEQQERESLLQEQQKRNLQQQEKAHLQQNQMKQESDMMLHQQHDLEELQKQEAEDKKTTVPNQENMKILKDVQKIDNDLNTPIHEFESKQHEKQENHKELITTREEKVAQNNEYQHGAQEKDAKEVQPKNQELLHHKIKHFEELIPFYSFKELDTGKNMYTEQLQKSRESEQLKNSWRSEQLKNSRQSDQLQNFEQQNSRELEWLKNSWELQQLQKSRESEQLQESRESEQMQESRESEQPQKSRESEELEKWKSEEMSKSRHFEQLQKSRESEQMHHNSRESDKLHKFEQQKNLRELEQLKNSWESQQLQKSRESEQLQESREAEHKSRESEQMQKSKASDQQQKFEQQQKSRESKQPQKSRESEQLEKWKSEEMSKSRHSEQLQKSRESEQMHHNSRESDQLQKIEQQQKSRESEQLKNSWESQQLRKTMLSEQKKSRESVQPQKSRESDVHVIVKPDNYVSSRNSAESENLKKGWQPEFPEYEPKHETPVQQLKYATSFPQYTELSQYQHQEANKQQPLQPAIKPTPQTVESHTFDTHTDDNNPISNHLPILIDPNEDKYSEISESLEFIPPWRDTEEMRHMNMVLGELPPDFTPPPQISPQDIDEKSGSSQSAEEQVSEVLFTDHHLQPDVGYQQTTSELQGHETKTTKDDTESLQTENTVTDELGTTWPPTTIREVKKTKKLPYTTYNKPYKGGSYYNREYLLPSRKLWQPKEGSDGPTEELPEELSLQTTTKETEEEKEDIVHHKFSNVIVTEKPEEFQILEDVEIKLIDKTYKQETEDRDQKKKEGVELKTEGIKQNLEEPTQDAEEKTAAKEIQPKEIFKKFEELMKKTRKDKTRPPDYYRAKQAEMMRENSIIQKEGPQRKPKKWPQEYQMTTTPVMKWGPTLDPKSQRKHSAAEHPVMIEKLPNSLQDLMQTDPEMYKRIQSYMAEKETPVEAAIEAKKEEATDDVNKKTVWMLVVIAVVGWIVFVVLLSLLVYNKRKGYCQRRRRKNSFSSKLRPRLAQHLLHPPITHISSPRPLNKPDLSMLNKALMPLSTDVITHNRSREFNSETRVKGRRTDRSKEEDSRSESSQSSKENREDSMEERPLPPIPHEEHPTPGPSGHKRPKHGSVGGSTSSAYESLDKYEQKNKKAQQPRVKQWNTIASIKAYTGLNQMMLQEAKESLNPVKIPPWEKQLRRGYMGKGFRPNEDEVHPVTKTAVPHSFAQQSTPFLAIKRNASETDSDSPVTEKRKAKESGSQRLKGRKVNSMSSWKSITTLDTQHTGDGEEVYNQLQTIANTFDNIADSVSSGSPHSSKKRSDKDKAPPIPPKSPLIKTGFSYLETHGMTHYPTHMKRDCVDRPPRNVTTIRTPTINL